MENPILLELGYGLIPLVDKEKGSILLEDISALRKNDPKIPKFRIQDNMQLEPFQISIGLEGNIEKPRFASEVFSLDEKADASTIMDCILQYFEKHPQLYLRKHFRTGESLSFTFERPSRGDFQINLMLPDYPTFWNRSYSFDKEIKSNCNYAYFITEVSKYSDEAYKVEIINTTVADYDNRYYLAGRFKFYLKIGDTLNFLYYDDAEKYQVKATVVNLANNTIDLSFDKCIEIPTPFLESNISNRCNWF